MKFSLFIKITKKLRLSSNGFLGNANINGDWVLKFKQAAEQKVHLDAKNYISQIKGWKLTIRGH